MPIYNVGYKSVNLYLIDNGQSRLLIDSGYPSEINLVGKEMRKTGLKISDIDYLIVTHFHVDHAGAIQKFKNQGVKFILLDIQVPYISKMEKMVSLKWNYLPLRMDDNVMMSVTMSREFLSSHEFKGEIIATPGHSDDSISLVLDSGEAFTGDLTAEYLVMEEDKICQTSWQNIRKLGAIIVYPSHGLSYKV